MKKIPILILAVFTLILTFSAVNAADENVAALSDSQNIVDEKTFDAIQNTLDSGCDEILLNDTYSGSGNAININKSVNIKGLGDSTKLNGRSKSQIMTITADNVTVENIIFVLGKDSNSAGAIYASGNNIKIINCTFTSNSAQYGGAILAEGKNISIINCKFSKNSAIYTGGAIQIDGNNNQVKNCIFTDNTASHVGGAVAWIGTNGFLTNSKFTSTISDYYKISQYGGAVVWMGSNGKLTKSHFFTYSARNHGSAIYWKGNNGSVNYCIFENNTSENISAYWGNPDYADYNYWGNITSKQDFINQNLIYYNDSSTSPKNWIVIERCEYAVTFKTNDGDKLNESLPDYELNSTATISNNEYILMKSTKVYCSNVATYCLYNGKYLQITLKDQNGNPLSAKTVKIKINNVAYEKTTDFNGVVKLHINIKNSGTYLASVSFNEDKYYKSSTKTVKITVKKQKPEITLKTKTLKVKTKKKVIKIVLKNQFKKTISKTTVKLTINKKTYKAKTNSKGIASFKVSLKAKKNYKYTVKFTGNKFYKAISKKGTVKVK